MPIDYERRAESVRAALKVRFADYWDDERVRVRFWAKVARNGDCWLWQGAIAKDGYGRLKIRATEWKAHRMAWMLEHGAIPADRFVLHKCDVRACCRPSHLYLGTQADNMRDCAQRGLPGGRRVAITAQDLAEMRRLAGRGVSQRSIAKRYGVSATSVGRWLRGEAHWVR